MFKAASIPLSCSHSLASFRRHISSSISRSRNILCKDFDIARPGGFLPRSFVPIRPTVVVTQEGTLFHSTPVLESGESVAALGWRGPDRYLNPSCTRQFEQGLRNAHTPP